MLSALDYDFSPCLLFVFAARASTMVCIVNHLQVHEVHGGFIARRYAFCPCTCFLYFRHEPDSLDLVDRWINSLTLQGYKSNWPWNSQQGHLYMLLRTIMKELEQGKAPKDYKIGLLPPVSFPSGRRAFQYYKVS